MAADQLFCPHCGAQQLKAGARFCHICGRTIPVAPAVGPTPIEVTPARRRRLNAWWLLPLLLIAGVALAFALWEPARDRVSELVAGNRPAATGPAGRGPEVAQETRPADATAGSAEVTSAAPTATLVLRPTFTPTPLATAAPRPTATPPPTATPVPTATPLADVTISAIVPPGSLGLIAFYSERDGNAEIYIMDADGGNQRRLTFDPADDLYPALSPDGRRLAFVSQRDGNAEIYVMDSDGSNLVRLTYDAAEDRLPAWSPDGKRITFASDRSGTADLYVLDANGENLVRLTAGPERDGHPVWSPDGAWLAFNSGSTQPTTWEIKTISVVDGVTRRLTANTVIDWSPCWSADGSSILFLSRRSAQNAIYAISPDGSQERKIFEGLKAIWGAVWSPDGQHIAFTSSESGRDEIYVIRSDGSDLRQLTFEGGAYPSWR